MAWLQFSLVVHVHVRDRIIKPFKWNCLGANWVLWYFFWKHFSFDYLRVDLAWQEMERISPIIFCTLHWSRVTVFNALHILLTGCTQRIFNHTGHVANAKLANEGGFHLYLWMWNADILSRIARDKPSGMWFKYCTYLASICVLHRCRVISWNFISAVFS